MALLIALALAGSASGAARPNAEPSPVPAVVAVNGGNPSETAFALLDPTTLRQVGRTVSSGKMSFGEPVFSTRSPGRGRLALATFDQIRVVDLRRRRLVGTLPGRFFGAPAWPLANRLIGLDLSRDVDHVVVIDPDRRSVITRRDIPDHTTLQAAATPLELVVMKDTGLGSPLGIVAHGTSGVRARIGLGLIRSGVESVRAASGMPPLAQRAIKASRLDLARRTGRAVTAIRTLAVTPGYWTVPVGARFSCEARREGVGVTVNARASGYAIILAAGNEDYRYHVFLHGPPALCARYPTAGGPQLPVNNLLDAKHGTSHGPALMVAAPRRQVFVVTSDGRIAHVDLATRRLRYVLLRRPFPPGAALDKAAWIGAGHLAVALRASAKTISSGIWSIDLETRTARLVARDPQGCMRLTAGAGLILVHAWPDRPIRASCRGLRAYDVQGRMRFRLFRDRQVFQVQIAGSRAYATMADPRRIAVVNLGTGRILDQVELARPIQLLLPG